MRLYQWLLRAYPSSFREEYGAELTRVFARQHTQAGGAFSRLTLWIAAIADVLGNALLVHVDLLRQDLRQSARTLVRTRGFASAAIVVIALGVGATTAAFTLTDYVLLRPLP